MIAAVSGAALLAGAFLWPNASAVTAEFTEDQSISAQAIPDEAPPALPESRRWTAKDAKSFWTAARMADAKPLPLPDNAKKPVPHTGRPAPHGAAKAASPARGAVHEFSTMDLPSSSPIPTDSPTGGASSSPPPAAASTTPSAPASTPPAPASPSGSPSPSPTPSASTPPPSPSQPFAGLPMVGRMYLLRNGGSYFCTASVINSPHHNIILTAGHCLDTAAPNDAMAFVPQWTAAKPQPYGIFPVNQDSEGRGRVWIDPRYYDRGRVQGDQWDVAFAEVGPGTNGKQVQDVVGGNDLATGRGYAFGNVTLVGYPGDASQPLTCTSSTTQFTPTDGTPGSFLRIGCQGYKTGTSGGPFLADFNPQTGTGDVVGSIGGWDTGGPTADVSYSANYGTDIQNLYNTAVSGAAPARPNVLPSASTMAHASAIASGYFTPSPTPGKDYGDMIVRWSDGELTLYRGAGNGRFDKEIQLAKSGSVWSKAVSITAGDFVGANTYDLVVRWTDGSLSLFPDVDATGLHKQIVLVKPGSLWQHAASITAGRFSSTDKWPDDLIVRWSDGELTLYPDVDGKGLHSQVQLAKPHSVWTHASSVAAGDFAGNNTWDLMVRWSDGELDAYPDVDEHGVKTEVRERNASPLWTNATLTTSGNYGTGPWNDDYVVRWSDGELSMYGNTGKALGQESVLVTPSANTNLPPVRG
ncbi:trypsin-like serine peptidase [Streptomyces silvisoli]|uniref:Peptidase S1 domain-containing protein n=1 Tax=Streptomyces silvisoli TaxID=3034235 RepID=A0ABT5ZHK2_9ACTN|nr:hypothetical protein [Streptomyces silvisoli]MDF3289291.1 hypothetical protein [Streptomyces silvisoli]